MKIIAYGSLLNKESLEKSLEREASLYKIKLEDYQRVFDAPFDKYSFLNLEKRIDSIIEAAYFGLSSSELDKFALREAGSELLEIKKGYYAFVWPKKYCQKLPVLQSYIDVCLKGSKNNNINFWRGTQMPNIVINDRLNPLYP